MPTDAVVHIRGLSKRFGSTVALAQLDLDVAAGTVFGFLGPNGAGKTTTIRLLLGLLRPSAGVARVFGLDCVGARDVVHRRVGYLPGDFAPYANLTGAQYLGYLAALRGGVDPRRIDELVDRFELDVTRGLGTLSRGNRQKVGLVQAFMHEPELLVFDEPTSGLDPLMQHRFRELVETVRDRGSTVFLSSHVLGEVEEIADTVGIVRSGRLVVIETLDNLKEQARRKIDITFEHEVPAETLRRTRGVCEVEVSGRTARLVVQGSMDDLFRAAASSGVENVVASDAPLEEILLGYYSADSAGGREG